MDTRTKIVAAAPPGAACVTGYFDVLTAELVRELRDIRQTRPGVPLAAVVLPLVGALLPLRARAELVAALAVIDYVLIAETEHFEALGCEVIRLETADRERDRRFREHVRSRHGC